MKIESKVKGYTFKTIEGIFDKKKELLSPFKGANFFYIVDSNVYKLYNSEIKRFVDKSPVLVIPATEGNKSYIKIADYYKRLIKNNFRKNDVLVTFGGGTLQDISGFIASTIFRGVRWVFFPTTLLAQADSCIGSKTSINFEAAKNTIGTFYPPDYIYSDPAFCKTLSKRYFNSGIGEIIKFHLMSNPRRYGLLKKYLNYSGKGNNPYFKEVIESTLNIKYSYFKGDEFDSGRRNLLNYGHCFGHALESASNYSVCHGEAVIVGMGFADLLSLKRGIMKKEKYDEFEDIFRRHYPRFNVSKISDKDIIYYLKRDKKRVGKDLTMILCHDIGKQFKYADIKEKEIVSVYKDFFRQYLK